MHVKFAFQKIEGSDSKCKICGEIKKNKRNHYLKHFPEQHRCHLCNKIYTRKDNLNSHLKRYHVQNVKKSVSRNSCPEEVYSSLVGPIDLSMRRYFTF